MIRSRSRRIRAGLMIARATLVIPPGMMSVSSSGSGRWCEEQIHTVAAEAQARPW